MKKSELDILYQFPQFKDGRGTLVVWENEELPFHPARTFLISDVPKGKSRANHAVSCDLLLIAITGSVRVSMNKNDYITLNDRQIGLLIKQNTFIELDEFTENTQLLVFASKPFNKTTYLPGI